MLSQTRRSRFHPTPNKQRVQQNIYRLGDETRNLKAFGMFTCSRPGAAGWIGLEWERGIDRPVG